MQTKRIGVVAGIFVAAVALTGCHSSSAQGGPTASRSSTAAAVDEGYDEPPAVGSTATAAPYPDCALAVAGWTAASTGKPWVEVNADGVDTVSATVTLTSGDVVKQSFTIPGGEDTHVFEFNDVAPDQVKSVIVSAAGNARSQGGACVATGGPDA